MSHPLIKQLHFSRYEFKRALNGLIDEDARRRFTPMNCISWNIGHLAAQEQRYWLTGMQGKTPLPDLEELYGYGSPASTPALDEVWDAWELVTQACNEYLNKLDTAGLSSPFLHARRPTKTSVGTVLLRQIYHYWYHTGENSAIRQMLGHKNLPDFVGDINRHAPYQPH